jgi:hypothetical protein
MQNNFLVCHTARHVSALISNQTFTQSRPEVADVLEDPGDPGLPGELADETTRELTQKTQPGMTRATIKGKVKFSHYRPEQALGDPVG